MEAAAGLHTDLPDWGEGSSWNGSLFSGFLFHSVKEKGYTRGTEGNKGHCSGAVVSSLPFFLWTEIKANRVILTLSPFIYLPV